VTATGGAIGTEARTEADRPAGRVRRIEEAVDPTDRRMVALVRAPGRVVIAAGALERIKRQKEAGQRLKRARKLKARRRAETGVARRWPGTRR